MNDRNEILTKVNKLVDVYRQGLLGGEKMPEELRKYRTCGIVFLVMNLALTLMIFFMVLVALIVLSPFTISVVTL